MDESFLASFSTLFWLWWPHVFDYAFSQFHTNPALRDAFVRYLLTLKYELILQQLKLVKCFEKKFISRIGCVLKHTVLQHYCCRGSVHQQFSL